MAMMDGEAVDLGGLSDAGERTEPEARVMVEPAPAQPAVPQAMDEPAPGGALAMLGAVFARMGKARWVILCVGLPTLLAVIYYGLIASDVYMSESRFVLKSQSQKPSQALSLASLIQSTSMSSSQEQSVEVIEYVNSRQALADLGHRIDVRSKFMSQDGDIFARFPGPFQRDRMENLFHFYNRMVEVHLDRESGVAVMQVKAFSAADAHDINAALLGLSEDFVNRLNQRAEQQAIAEDQMRVAQAENRVRAARIALAKYRNSEQLLDPAKQATGALEVSNLLVGEQAALKSQLQLMQRVAPANPSIPALQSRIAAIGAQIDAQNGRVTGSPKAIASKLTEYEKLSTEQDFALQALASASAALEQARTEAQKQQYYLERISEPSLPDLARLPARLRDILTVALSALFLYFVGWLLIVGILEHAPED